jgi:L-alanine-DL-glutamate epimerase-like enolase superfamily enzyme
MQITNAEVTPVELKLKQPVRMSGIPQIKAVTAIFVRLETKGGRNAWGCGVAHPGLTGQQPDDVISACNDAADMVPDLHPIDIEYSLSHLMPLLADLPPALCAFDLAFHDLLGLAAGMPLYRLLGGYRRKIETSATIPLGSVEESMAIAQMRVQNGYRLLKIKGGFDPQEDIRRVRAIHRAFPDLKLRLDADGGYSIQDAIDVARTLGDRLEMLEQPTPAEELDGLFQVTRHSSVPVLADQSISGPRDALELALHHYADGFSIKIGCCGGFNNARQMDGVARAVGLVMMVSCLIEPALLTAAGLSLALSSPGVGYADLDGHLDLAHDPTIPGFRLEDGWLVATDVPGLGCMVDL